MSASHKRIIKGYLKPKQYALFKGYCKREDISMSSGLNEVIKLFFSSVPPEKHREYLTANK